MQAKDKLEGAQAGRRRVRRQGRARIVPDNPLHFLHPWRSDALSENLLRSALSEGTGEAGAAPGEHFFGYFLVATRKYLAYPGETGLIDRRQRRHE